MKIEQVAVQLYTLRDQIKTAGDYDATLRKVAEIGYKSVQVSGPRPVSPKEIAELCAKHGLTINSSHEDSTLILEEPEKAVANLDALGCEHTAYPFPKGVDFGSEAGVDAFIEQLNAAGKVFADSGKTLSYHNHNHEFRKIGGEIILDRIFRKTDPRYLQGEPDTYWIQMGGGSPEAWCRKLAGRLPLLHLKDFRTTEENKPTFAEIGNGVLDFKAIVAAAETSGCQWFIVEQDACPGDPFDSLAQSFRYIRDNLVS
ncbi:MAG: sugar phosphate isomerase/epimerase [Opitutales bacterium]|nr:sugar phosphate isomerase/epimerase [Opitutales bacterium]